MGICYTNTCEMALLSYLIKCSEVLFRIRQQMIKGMRTERVDA